MNRHTELKEDVQLKAQRHVSSSRDQVMMILPPTAPSKLFKWRSILTVQHAVIILTMTGRG